MTGAATVLGGTGEVGGALGEVGEDPYRHPGVTNPGGKGHIAEPLRVKGIRGCWSPIPADSRKTWPQPRPECSRKSPEPYTPERSHSRRMRVDQG